MESLNPSSAQTSASSDVDAARKIFFERLKEGFRFIKERRRSSTATLASILDCDTANDSVLIRIVDASSMASSVVTSSGPTSTPYSFYDTLYRILESECGMSLNKVNYAHFRSGHTQIIDQLSFRAVRCDITDAASIHLRPSEWHNNPYCYVYLAACGSYDDYRNKVKPSVQAFIRQIESAVKASDATAENTAPTPQPHIVIVHIPLKGENMEDIPQRETARRVGAAFAGVRQMMRANREDGGPVSNEKESHVEADDDGMTMAKHLTKVDRDIARRFAADFPRAEVCTFSSLTDKGEESETDAPTILKNEVMAFSKALGIAIAEGFKERCQHFDDEVRRLDSKRAERTSRKKPNETGFNLNEFVLVKEGFALTYEQMNLASEALLHYNELHAFLPDIRNDIDAIFRACGNSEATEFAPELVCAAISGDSPAFREKLKEHESALTIADVFEQYLLSREIWLGMKMGNPIQVLNRILSFANTMHAFKAAKASKIKDEQERLEANLNAEEWAFQFSWDLKDCVEKFISDDTITTPKNSPEKRKRVVDLTFSRHVCNVLEIARLRFVKLGLYRLPGDPLVLRLTNPAFGDLQNDWIPYDQITRQEELSEDHAEREISEATIECVDLTAAFSSSSAFQSQYLDILKFSVAANRSAERYRSAARLQADLVEINLREGKRKSAAHELDIMAQVFEKDQWKACHFLMLFRLASLQREICTPERYICTLVKCFRADLSSLVPRKAIELLFRDLEFLISKVSGVTFQAPPLFTPSLDVKRGNEFAPVRGERGTVKALRTVGNPFLIRLELDNHLPAEIVLDKVQLGLVSFRTMVAANEEDEDIQQCDICKRLTINNQVACQGKNTYEFEWTPVAPGQFVIAFVMVEWKEGTLVYGIRDLRSPIARIDVIPSDSNQKLRFDPPFLMPGQTQPINVVHEAGIDHIEDATLEIVASDGIMFSENLKDPTWMSSGTIILPKCPPKDSVEVVLMVKTDRESSGGLNAKVSSSYRCTATPDGDISEEDSLLRAHLDAFASMIGKSALALEGMDFNMYGPGKAVLNVSIASYTPGLIRIKSWSLSLPSFLSESENNNLNEGLVGSVLAKGDRLLFAFDCDVMNTIRSETLYDVNIEVNFEDGKGTLFAENLSMELKVDPGSTTPRSQDQVVSLDVTPSTSEGFVGQPIRLHYKCGSSSFLEMGVSYEILPNESSWLISGRSRGAVEVAPDGYLSIEIVAIPLHPGLLSNFPGVTLSRQLEGGDRESLPCSVTSSSTLYAHLPQISTAVAFHS